jgi:hypothetical protein
MNEYPVEKYPVSQWAAHKSAAKAIFTAAQQEKDGAIKHFLLQYFYQHSDAAHEFIRAEVRRMHADYRDNE